MSGFDSLVNYSSFIFNTSYEAGTSSITPEIGNMILGASIMIASMLGIFLIDHFRRRRIMLLG